MVPGFLHYQANRKQMTPEVKEILVEELLKILPIKVRRRGAPIQDDSKDRQALSAYVEGAFKVLCCLKEEKMPTHFCLIRFHLIQFPNGPAPFDKLGVRFLELLEEQGIIYHYCPCPSGPGSETVIF